MFWTALMTFIVVLVANWLTANVALFPNYYANLFFWALVLAFLGAAVAFPRPRGV